MGRKEVVKDVIKGSGSNIISSVYERRSPCWSTRETGYKRVFKIASLNHRKLRGYAPVI